MAAAYKKRGFYTHWHVFRTDDGDYYIVYITESREVLEDVMSSLKEKVCFIIENSFLNSDSEDFGGTMKLTCDDNK